LPLLFLNRWKLKFFEKEINTVLLKEKNAMALANKKKLLISSLI
jgi:hypothetical protein